MAKSKNSLKQVIADGTKSAQGYAFVKPEDVAGLVESGHVLINPAIATQDGKVAARATDMLLSEFAVASSAPKVAYIASSFEIAPAGIPIPVKQRGGYKTESYPFSKLEIGQSFVVPATAENPNPVKTFASTVSSAARRFAETTGETKQNRKGETVPVLKTTREFTIHSVVAGTVYSNGFSEPATGARVFRTK